jgi:CheY-like chemotaxis protein
MRNIIIIDDDPTNNILCEFLFKYVAPQAVVTSYLNPEVALSSISCASIDTNTIILLDLNMPEMDGWEFLEKFELLKMKCIVFILTSSINPADREEAAKHSMVKGFLPKPLSEEDINFILGIHR